MRGCWLVCISGRMCLSACSWFNRCWTTSQDQREPSHRSRFNSHAKTWPQRLQSQTLFHHCSLFASLIRDLQCIFDTHTLYPRSPCGSFITYSLYPIVFVYNACSAWSFLRENIISTLFALLPLTRLIKVQRLTTSWKDWTLSTAKTKMNAFPDLRWWECSPWITIWTSCL